MESMERYRHDPNKYGRILAFLLLIVGSCTPYFPSRDDVYGTFVLIPNKDDTLIFLHDVQQVGIDYRGSYLHRYPGGEWDTDKFFMRTRSENTIHYRFASFDTTASAVHDQSENDSRFWVVTLLGYKRSDSILYYLALNLLYDGHSSGIMLEPVLPYNTVQRIDTGLGLYHKIR